jgi:membrane protein
MNDTKYTQSNQTYQDLEPTLVLSESSGTEPTRTIPFPGEVLEPTRVLPQDEQPTVYLKAANSDFEEFSKTLLLPQDSPSTVSVQEEAPRLSRLIAEEIPTGRTSQVVREPLLSKDSLKRGAYQGAVALGRTARFVVSLISLIPLLLMGLTSRSVLSQYVFFAPAFSGFSTVGTAVIIAFAVFAVVFSFRERDRFASATFGLGFCVLAPWMLVTTWMSASTFVQSLLVSLPLVVVYVLPYILSFVVDKVPGFSAISSIFRFGSFFTYKLSFFVVILFLMMLPMVRNFGGWL